MRVSNSSSLVTGEILSSVAEKSLSSGRGSVVMNLLAPHMVLLTQQSALGVRLAPARTPVTMEEAFLPNSWDGG